MIDIEQIEKRYGTRCALDGFSLHVREGELFGLVGPNGAGKSTLIKILSTLIQPDRGRARIAGIDVAAAPREVKRIVGYMPDVPGIYQDMRVREFLEFFSDAFHVPSSLRQAKVDQALQRSGLADRADSFVEELSFGWRQRLQLAKTLIHDPKVLLLDEPATGLDPLARIQLREKLKQLNAEGVTILVSSHILADLEDICTRIALISDGKNTQDADGRSIIELRLATAATRRYEMDIVGDVSHAASAVAAFAHATLIHTTGRTLTLELPAADDAVTGAFLRSIVAAKVTFVRFAPSELTLEDRYRAAFGEQTR